MKNNPACRLVTIDEGVMMVVTDLHGDLSLYRRYRDLFIDLRHRGQADWLVVTGDCIHREGSEDKDRSLDIVLDLIELRAELGECLTVLMGNHELPHLYPFILTRGVHEYTSRFEHAMGPHRRKIVEFFDSLPFYVRTGGGVSLCHAGAFAGVRNGGRFRRFLEFSHRDLLQSGRRRLPSNLDLAIRAMFGDSGLSYDQIVREAFAVTGPRDDRYYDYLASLQAMRLRSFSFLWDAFFTGGEMEFGEKANTSLVDALLGQLSAGYRDQKVLVTGHLRCAGGFTLTAGGRQLRIASGAHAVPSRSARYLLFDAGQPTGGGNDLCGQVRSVYRGEEAPG